MDAAWCSIFYIFRIFFAMKLFTQVGLCGTIELQAICCKNIESDYAKKNATCHSEKLILINAMSAFGQLIYLSYMYNDSENIFYKITVL